RRRHPRLNLPRQEQGRLTLRISIVLIAACMTITAGPSMAAPAAVTVRISNFVFGAPAITVAPGTTVTWVNDDDIPHTAVAGVTAVKLKVLDPGDRFSFTFTTAGRYGSFCSIHPHMTGLVVVKAS